MRNAIRFCISSLVLILALPSISAAQENTWRVGLSGRDTLSECVPQAVDDSLFTLVCSGTLISVPVDSVDFLSRHRKSRFWTGAGYGTLVGGAAGALIGLATYQKPEPKAGQWFTLDFGPGASALGGAVLGIVGGFVIGGAIGASAGGDEIYRLSDRFHQQKLMMIRKAVLDENKAHQE